jgi:DNA ligase-1
MDRLASAAEAIGNTPKKNEKIHILAEYLRSRPVEEAAISAVFLSGRAFPAWEQSTLQVGGALLVRVLLEVSGKHETQLEKAYRKTGDLGAAAYDLLSTRTSPPRTGDSRPDAFGVLEVEHALRAIAVARGLAAKAVLLRQLLERATPLQAKYLIKIVTGEWRIGLKESLVEEAIAVAYQAQWVEVQRANMLLGDIGETLRLAAAQRLAQARLRLFHPLGFMLASPIEWPVEGLAFFPSARVEDKYDGIRAQAHCSERQVRIFSRTRDDITESFPELVEPLRAFADVIFDGEVVAWDFARAQALPFTALQPRLGRKKVSPSLLRSAPAAYVVFDLLYANGELLLDRPLRERGELLDHAFAQAELLRSTTVRRGHLWVRDLQGELAFEPAVIEKPEPPEAAPAFVLRTPVLFPDSPQALAALFRHAQARGNEGLMIKDPASVYTPGRRGRSWLKMKRELATLDVVVTSVEWGHGKRAGVLSDYTFAVRESADHPEPLLNVGKAYSGLTDREIAELTHWFVQHTVADHGFWREVEPKIVVEVAFNAVMRSDRHSSGYALRFPRIVRLRPDKSADDIDTLDRVRGIFERQTMPRVA